MGQKQKKEQKKHWLFFVGWFSLFPFLVTVFRDDLLFSPLVSTFFSPFLWFFIFLILYLWKMLKYFCQKAPKIWNIAEHLIVLKTELFLKLAKKNEVVFSLFIFPLPQKKAWVLHSFHNENWWARNCSFLMGTSEISFFSFVCVKVSQVLEKQTSFFVLFFWGMSRVVAASNMELVQIKKSKDTKRLSVMLNQSMMELEDMWATKNKQFKALDYVNM